MNLEELMAYLAGLVTDMEEEAGCVGATAEHFKNLFAGSIKAERNDQYIPLRMLTAELVLEARVATEREEAREILEGLFTPDEEEAIYSGEVE